jgi:hypothetical protein
VFHALPVSHGKSIVNSNWIRDMVDFYGLEIFLAETSATCGGLDSLLEPTGPLREAQQLAATTFGSRQTYFVTNGTSTANKVDTPEIHGYRAECGYRVYVDKALEIAATARPAPPRDGPDPASASPAPDAP